MKGGEGKERKGREGRGEAGEGKEGRGREGGDGPQLQLLDPPLTQGTLATGGIRYIYAGIIRLAAEMTILQPWEAEVRLVYAGNNHCLFEGVGVVKLAT